MQYLIGNKRSRPDRDSKTDWNCVPLFGKGARAPPPNSHRPDTRERRKSSLWSSLNKFILPAKSTYFMNFLILFGLLFSVLSFCLAHRMWFHIGNICRAIWLYSGIEGPQFLSSCGDNYLLTLIFCLSLLPSSCSSNSCLCENVRHVVRVSWRAPLRRIVNVLFLVPSLYLQKLID